MMKIGHFINNVQKYLPFYLDYYRVTGADDPKAALFQQNITESVLGFYIGNSTNLRNVPMTAYAKVGTILSKF